MVALLHPGVYVQEVSGGARVIEGVPTSTAIFVGETERGPLSPVKIRSIAEYERLFGGHQRPTFADADPFAAEAPVRVTMRYSMDLFFQNGGTTAYVLRASTNGVVTHRTVNPDGTGAEVFVASSPGEWGRQLFVLIVASTAAGRFRVVIYYVRPGETEPTLVEDFDRLVTDPADENYFGTALSRSLYVRWVDGADPTSILTTPADLGGRNVAELTLNDFTTVVELADTQFTSPEPNRDVTLADTDLPTVLARLDGIEDAAVIVGATERWAANVFGIGEAGIDAIRTYYHAIRAYVENRPKQDLFYVADIPSFAPGTPNFTSVTLDAVSSAKTFVLGNPSPTIAPMNVSTFVGVYWPHFRLADPVGPTLTSTRLIPPAGAVAGLYARTDARRGVWKAPAGVEATMGGVVRLDLNLIDSQQDDLNPIGVNVVRPIPGAGTVVWGSRTLVPASEWRYVPVRRTAMFLRKSIFNGIQFAVFEPNDAPLWGTLRATIGAFMETQFRNGAFAGSSSREAFFVKVDAETTTPSDQAAGVVNILVGFAPLRPAEFVVVKLSQKTAIVP